MNHFVQGGCNQAGEPDDVNILLAGGFQDFFARHHDSQVNHLIVVALKYDPYNIFSYIVNIAFHSRHEDFSLGLLASALFRLDIGNKVGHSLLHDPGTFYHLRQEHLAIAKEIAHDVHAIHQRAFDNLNRVARPDAAFLSVFNNKGSDTFDQGMLDTLFYRPLTPRQVFFPALAALVFVALGDLQQTIGPVVTAIEHDIFHQLFQLG